MDQPDDSSEAVAEAIKARLTEIGLDEEPATAREVLQEFVAAIGTYRESALDAFRAKDDEALAHAAHKLAGTALTLGAEGLGRKASRIETDVGSGRTATLDAQVGELASATDHVVAAVETILGTLS